MDTKLKIIKKNKTNKNGKICGVGPYGVTSTRIFIRSECSIILHLATKGGHKWQPEQL